MRQPKNYNLPEVFNATSIGFVFEFYSSKAENFIVENLSKLTTKTVTLTNDKTYEPSFGNAILVKEYNGKKPRYIFSLAQQKYSSIITIMESILDWISNTADCTIDNVMRINISFDHKHLETLSTLIQLDTNKLVLKIDEDYIYERFPFQKGSPYAMSVKKLLPISETTYTQDLVKNVNYIIGTPEKDYYGINFEDISKNVIQFNYIGGEDYAENKKGILEVLNYYILMTYQTLNEPEYTKPELFELRDLTDDFLKIQEAFYDADSFYKLYPDIKVNVNMSKNEQVIKTYWTMIRSKLFEAVVNHKLKKGEFNYDTDDAQFQLRNAKINCSGLSRFDLVKCDIRGIVESSNLIGCKVNNARIYNSKIVFNNDIKSSYLNAVTIDKKNKIEKCLVENNHEMLNCKITNSVIKFAGIGRSAVIDEESTIVDREEFVSKPKPGINVEEDRDYKWFQKLGGSTNEKGYGNEYIRPKYIK